MTTEPTTRRGDQTAEAIRNAAIRLFYEHGYEATTLRQIASEVGITVGSVYNHIDSKEELLYSIMSGIMRDLLSEMEGVVARYPEPLERLQATMEFHLVFHAERAQEVFIGNFQLRGLSPARRAAVIESRSAYEAMFVRTLEEGMQTKVFHVTDARLVAYGIIAMGSHVADWYRPGGRLGLGEIATIYADFILRAVTNPKAQVTDGGMLLAPPVVGSV